MSFRDQHLLSVSHLILFAYFLITDPYLIVRPRTFWRKTKRSGVTGAFYSPASHLVRRSTFLAAGLSLDSPDADLSALGVESRVSVLVLGPDHSLQLYPCIGW